MADAGAGLSWAGLFGIVAVGATLIGGGWTIVNGKIEGVREDATQGRAMIREELTRRETELKAAIQSIEHELSVRRADFMSLREFQQFEKRYQERMSILEHK